MASPKLDEHLMMMNLRRPLDMEHLQTLQAGAFQLIIDAYDRKVTRESMIEATVSATHLLAQLGKFYAIEVVRHCAEGENISLEDVLMSRSAIAKVLSECAQDAIRKADMLTQCPRDEDPIN